MINSEIIYGIHILGAIITYCIINKKHKEDNEEKVTISIMWPILIIGCMIYIPIIRVAAYLKKTRYGTRTKHTPQDQSRDL